MGIIAEQQDSPRSRKHTSDEREFRLLVALTFPIFLVLVLVGNLIGKRPPADNAAARQSIFAEAKAAASTTIAMAFMG